MTLDQVLDYKTHWDKKKEKEVKGTDTFGKDAKLPVKFFEQANDNSVDQLHPAR